MPAIQKHDKRPPRVNIEARVFAAATTHLDLNKSRERAIGHEAARYNL